MDKIKNAGCFWLNGPRESGRDELARMLTASLNDRGMLVECLDEETIDTQLGPKRGETTEIACNPLLRAAFTAHLLNRNGVAVVISAGVPDTDLRRRVRDKVPHLVEVAIDAPDIHNPMEGQEPVGWVEPNIILNIGQENPAKEQLDESLARLIKFLEVSGHIPAAKQEELTAKEAALVQERLKALGYL